MAKAAPAKSNSERNEAFYTKLIVYPKRRLALGIMFFINLGLFTLLLHKELRAETPWMVFAMPLIVSGLLWLLFPATEEWEYKPWQNNKQKQERMFIN